MRKLLSVFSLALLPLSVWWLSDRGDTAPADAREGGPHASSGREPAKPSAAATGATTDPEAAATIRALRHELAQKDQRLQRVLIHAAAADPEPRAQPPEDEHTKAVESAAATLNQRLFDAPPDAALAARLESVLEAVTRRLPEEVQSELACASTLCRVVLRGSAAAVSSATNELTHDAPKLFIGSVVLPTADGESTLYVAREPGILDLSPPETTL
ncbi:MAG TPA: hypothetical protein VMG12_14905 [Polyangiaceae bacterium]|nr:hypothetical protein [Polyangiaceae bacterium]